ncbi:hypothetical protein HGRIS_013328 [Hohenbuehelia grisea]|uniref:RRM domain-containing protein n=1 Tax=Hohenbuehelia grisea TaxID=104357 RepID=A0ABR3IV36_9AGAR
MAYNQHREWDRGKETWKDNAVWDGARGNIHGRDDDYYNDGKRRKFNNGGYDASYSYDESGYDGNYGQYTQQNDWSQDAQQGDRGQRGVAAGGFGAKKRMQASEPSQHVIFLGLDPDFTEADLQAYLSSYGCSVETVTIIRERSTGISSFVSASAHVLT